MLLCALPPCPRLIVAPHPVLTRRCADVPAGMFGPELEVFSRRMLAVMVRHGGVGLAAPQVAVPLRLFVTLVAGEGLVAVNPVVVAAGDPRSAVERCLSVPGVSVSVRRPWWVDVELSGPSDPARRLVRLEGFAARVAQHEIDHLDGVTIG